MTGIVETIGALAAVGFTIGVLTLPFKENVYWKVCEHLYLGFAGGYTLILAIQALNTTLIGQLARGNLMYIIPLILSILLYSRFAKRAVWLNRYPVALMVGVGTAISMRTVIDAMFVSQIQDTITTNLLATGTGVAGAFNAINNIILIVGVIASVFFFVFWEPIKSPTITHFRKLGMIFLLVSFACLVALEVSMRITRLGGRFFDLLAPENMLYTAVFSLLAIVSLALSRTKD